MSTHNYSQLEIETAQLARHIVKICRERNKMISTAESCTGGMLSAAITAVSGSSSVIELGVCSYSNRIKQQMLGVKQKTLEQYTEYSTQCAEEMALGIMRLSGADYGVATTGVAGPTGGSDEHPVGEVCMAVCSRNRIHSKRFVFSEEYLGAPSERDLIRAQAVRKALMLLDIMIMTSTAETP